MLWRQIWQPNLFIPLPTDEVIGEISDMLDSEYQPDFFKALDKFKKSRAVGPIKGDYCEVHYSEENVAEIRQRRRSARGPRNGDRSAHREAQP